METQTFVGSARSRSWWPAVLAALAWASCSPPSSARHHARSASSAPAPALGTPQTLVLVAIDGVRWRDVFEGVEEKRALNQHLPQSSIVDAAVLTPNLHALMARGAALGAPGKAAGIAASGPNFVSLPGYMEMLSGRRPTGCLDNYCKRVTWPTLADDFAALPGVRPIDVGVVASWPGIGRAASRAPSHITLSVGRTGGESRGRLRYDARAGQLLDAGERAGAGPGYGDFRRDSATAAIALRYLRQMKPRFLFIGLGETDEYAHHNNYGGYLGALHYADQVVGQVADALAGLRRQGRRATLFVTTDHGRSGHFVNHGGFAPESARTWLVAAGWGIDSCGETAPRRERHTADIASTLRWLGGLGPGSSSSEPLWSVLETRSDTKVALAPGAT